MQLDGSCHCGSVRFSVESAEPVPFMRCYCSICRKTAGGGGFAINIMGKAKSLKVRGKTNLRVYRAEIADKDGYCEKSSGEHNFCGKCASAMWLFDKNWPDLVHPFASAMDSQLPVPPEKVHLMLRYKAIWVKPDVGPKDKCFDEYPEQSIEDWHKNRGLWVK